MAYHHRVTLGPAVLEYQLGGILRIAQWQGDVVYLLLVVDDDGVGAVCCHGERVERVVLHVLGFGVYSIKNAIHHGACCHGTVGLFRAGDSYAYYRTKDSSEYDKSD